MASVVGLAGTASATPRARPAASATHRSVQAAPRIPAGATKLSSLSPAARLRVDVILRPADPGGLASYAQAVSTPGSPEFHDYLSTTAFASSFGPSPTALATVEAALRGDGLPSGHLSADHLSIRLKASAARLSRAFSTGFVRYRLRSGRTAFANTKAPMLPSAAALDVNGVVGLDDLTLEQAGAVRVATPRRHRSGAAVAPRIQTGGPQPCGAAVAGNAAGSYTADQVAAAYGFPSMYRQGDLGQGQTVAVIEGEPDLATDIAAYQSCYGTDTDVSYVAVDGGAGTGPGSGEAALDIEQIIGLAPEAHVVVYQSSPSATSIYDDLSQAVSDDTARVVSTSWGVCEAAATRLPDPTGGLGAAFGAVFQAENTLFEEAAVQGQSIVAASGDNGSEDCNTFRELGSGYASELSVDDPAGQPFVTGVGGTTLADPGAPSSETVWNSVGSGGGGISELWPMPGYQSGAPASLGVVNADSSGAPCGALSGDCREVPDVSADADPYTGYAIVWNGGWWSVGGTSAG
ncbi:MAG TPA: S53 family peptidase, partial [Acidimicrobiales bacterium]|nr:S53 family peptidase [Acidimicrobiales bacterium]